ncbi:MAG: hypothetical protein GWN01_03575 [Nitrosopumilaceae archaeon]|nr:hypothetical protein [Nitrosopumilaceae archaeon]NIU00038.1 hypothetical protein [Nitrosopumilaceae archaeon]NIU86417.1 hypothetical protein [Nitrosopumilaceae archaeon]NIV65126.1 hypothetical protein [Nitrosopumilaceae archaeon]NIX60640.1 hypothetical protein [Nitrosopumilaceae archaeon]
MQDLKEKLRHAFLYPYFIHAGISDAITTIFALNIGMMELNPLVSILYPENLVFMPAVLIAFAYGRTLAAMVLFKNMRQVRLALWFVLYFPAGFNIVNISLHLLNQSKIIF